MQSRRYITRLISPQRHTIGWFVRVVYGGQRRSKFLSDGVYGGSRKALQQAIRVRDAFEKELHKPRSTRSIPGKTTRSNSGVRGVSLMRKGKSRGYYVATWSPSPNKSKRALFSIERYGKAGALRRAKAKRVAMARKYYKIKE